MEQYFNNAYSMNYDPKRNIFEAGFLTPEEQELALKVEIVYLNIKMRSQKLHHATDVFTIIKATNINLETTSIKENQKTIENNKHKKMNLSGTIFFLFKILY